MRRCAHRRLDRDPHGEAIGPRERLERETRLGACDREGRLFSGSSYAFAFDPDVRLREIALVKRRAYFARYLRIPPSEVGEMTLDMLDLYADALAELLKAEAPDKTSIEQRAEQNFT